MPKIATIIGARPQFIKAAVVSRAIASRKKHNFDDASQINEIIIHTGQHYDRNMSEVFFDQMHIPKPDYFLNIKDLSHGAMTGQMLEKVESILLKENPDMVLVYGDTNTTLAGALAAAKLHIPTAHVEAGLRSFNRLMPEEINRVLTDHIASILFCSTRQAVENLKHEGMGKDGRKGARIPSFSSRNLSESSAPGPIASKQKPIQSASRVAMVGDVMLDAARYYTKFAAGPDFKCPEPFILATIHRAENTDNADRLASIFRALERIGQNTNIVLPLHPRTRKIIKKVELKINEKNILLCEPVSYLSIIHLLQRCRMVMTDSGGLQKEAFFFEKPCITLRTETEWVELVQHGFNRVAGTDVESILAAFEHFEVKKLDFNQNLYGDGRAGEKIVKILSEYN